MRDRAFALVWQQVDRAGIVDPLEQAMFVLGRLYPDMPDAVVQQVRADLAAERAAGGWHGFDRPHPSGPVRPRP
jgi:hypothetical protein